MKKEPLTREKELEAILGICVGLVVAYFATKQLHRGLLTISALVGMVGLFSNYLTSKIAWAWMKLAEIMGAVTSKIILSAVFFLFLFPIALLQKVFSKKDNLHLKRTEGNSYYFVRNHRFEAKDLEDLW
ncbi:MAG: hypothetical protein JWO06_1911 [Bacteroidota bacterium]|nr:hypothetical protein [Bacteroidota bacterium]